jgi:hypothetical protein
VRKCLHLPCENFHDTHFAHAGAVLSQALLDSDRVGELISLWDQSSPRTATDRRVVLSVDAVSFRPRVAIVDDLSVEELDDLKELKNREGFEQFLLHPKEFTEFLKNHWNHAYSAFFTFQIQPVLPGFPCCIIHAWPHCKGTGNDQSLKRLFQLQSLLERRFGFQAVGLAFDGDSIYSELHRNFEMQYEAQLTRGNWKLRTKSLPIGFLQGIYPTARFWTYPVLPRADILRVLFASHGRNPPIMSSLANLSPLLYPYLRRLALI